MNNDRALCFKMLSFLQIFITIIKFAYKYILIKILFYFQRGVICWSNHGVHSVNLDSLDSCRAYSTYTVSGTVHYIVHCSTL